MLMTAQTVSYLALVLAETAKQSPLTELEKIYPGVGCKKVSSQNNVLYEKKFSWQTSVFLT